MPFKKRMCWPFHEFTPDFGDEEVEAMAKLGFNQAAINFDSWVPAAPQIFQMADSHVWPGMGDPEVLEWSAWWLPEQVERCRKYGLEPYIYLFEPTVPFKQFSVYAPQSVREEFRGQIEDECLGYRCPGSPEETTEGYDFAAAFNSMGRPLCISHPKVQEFYRSRTEALARMLPGLKGVIICTGDGRMEFCDHNCPRCRTQEKIGATGYQTKGLITMLNCMHEGAAAVRPDFEILLDNHGLLDRTAEIAQGVKFPLTVLVKDTGGDSDMAPTEPGPAMRRVGRKCREEGIDWYVLSELCSAEEYGLIFGYPDPLTIIRKVKAFVAEDIENLATYWGVSPQAQTINDRVLSAVMLAPERNENEILSAISEEVFGKEARDAWVRAWHCVRGATEVWQQRRGYHNLRQNFYAARFRLFAWPITFLLTSPEGVPEHNWEWEICFRNQKANRDANLMIMPGLLEQMDCAITAAEEAMALIPEGTKPSRQVYRPHEDWDSRRYAQEAVDALRSVREIVASEMNAYRIAEVRDVVEDKSLPRGYRNHYALERLPGLFETDAEILKRMIPPLRTQLAHLRTPRIHPNNATMRTEGNTEKKLDRWDFLPLLEKRLADIPAAIERAKKWVEEKVG